MFVQVTTKGAGLNPNAKVWQEVPPHQDDVPEWTQDTTWLLTYPPAAIGSEGTGFWLHIGSTCDLGTQHRLHSYSDAIQRNRSSYCEATLMKLRVVLLKRGGYYKTQLLLLCF